MAAEFDYVQLRQKSPLFRDGARIRTDVIASLVEKVAEGRPFRLLDIGAADGLTLQRFEAGFPQGSFFGLDQERIRLKSAREKGLKVALGRAEQLPYPSASFEVVTMSATLKHIRNYGAVLDECRRVLIPGGSFILVDPTLWGVRVGFLAGHFLHEWTPNVWSKSRAVRILTEHGLGVRQVHRFMLLPWDYPGRGPIESCLRGIGLGGVLLQQAILARVDAERPSR